MENIVLSSNLDESINEIMKKIDSSSTTIRQKLVLYNHFQEILVFDEGTRYILPRIENIDGDISNMLGLELDDKKKVNLLSTTLFLKKFVCENGKLKPIYNKKRVEYYSYNIDFEPYIMGMINEYSYSRLNYFAPKLIKLSDLIKSSNSSSISTMSNLCALKELEKRLKLK